MAKRCCACSRAATRRLPDNDFGGLLYLCDVCPSPEQILQRAELVQATWCAEERLAREYHCSRSRAEYLHRVAYDADCRKAVVTWQDIDQHFG